MRLLALFYLTTSFFFHSVSAEAAFSIEGCEEQFSNAENELHALLLEDQFGISSVAEVDDLRGYDRGFSVGFESIEAFEKFPSWAYPFIKGIPVEAVVTGKIYPYGQTPERQQPPISRQQVEEYVQRTLQNALRVNAVVFSEGEKLQTNLVVVIPHDADPKNVKQILGESVLGLAQIKTLTVLNARAWNHVLAIARDLRESAPEDWVEQIEAFEGVEVIKSDDVSLGKRRIVYIRVESEKAQELQKVFPYLHIEKPIGHL